MSLGYVDSTDSLMQDFPESIPKNDGVYPILDSSGTGRVYNCRWSLEDMQWHDDIELVKYPVFTGVVWYFQEKTS